MCNTHTRFGIEQRGASLILHSESLTHKRLHSISNPDGPVSCAQGSPAAARRTHPAIFGRRRSLASLAAALILTLAAATARGQATEALVATPQPQIQLAQPIANSPQKSSERPADASAQNAPVETMFPAHGNGRYWISGQANIIFQGDLPFHSSYEGTNSFRNAAQYKTSELETLYTALRPTRSIRYSTDLILDVEDSSGRGLNQALGLASFTNLDVVRNPNLGSSPYLSRYQVHQVFGLTRETVAQEPGFFAVAPRVPVRRVEFRIGKMTLPDFFDVNSVGLRQPFAVHELDGRQQRRMGLRRRHARLHAWAAWPSTTTGSGASATASSPCPRWPTASPSTGPSAAPTARMASLSCATAWLHGRQGVERLLFYANRAHMGSYREAVDDFLNGSDTANYGVTVPTITLHAHYGALKYGFGYNFEQELTENLRLFGRFGWNDGANESFAYSEIDQSVEAGGDYTGARWHRPEDKIGLAVVSNAIKRDHQQYLELGGLGFLLGDGKLDYGRETIVESYYNLHAWRGLFYAVDVQHITNPGYNRDRGPVWVGSVRAHVDF